MPHSDSDGNEVHNEILLNLPGEEREIVFPKLEFVRLKSLQMLHEVGDTIKSAYVVGMQVAQIAACNRLHGVEERLARWLLMCADRAGDHRLPLTQDLLGQMLGTRRASVTIAAGVLQKAGFIDYRRGDVEIIDKEKLEETTCECYEIIRQQIEKCRSESP